MPSCTGHEVAPLSLLKRCTRQLCVRASPNLEIRENKIRIKLGEFIPLQVATRRDYAFYAQMEPQNEPAGLARHLAIRIGSVHRSRHYQVSL
jgi:hypothetical protein